MENSWIKLHRQFLKWEWYDDINVKILFLHCLLRANFEEQKWHGKEIKAGQFVTSIEHLSSETGLTTQQTRTALKKLEITKEINKQSTRGYSIITINNWDKWQENNKQITNKQQTSNKRITTIKEYKKERIYIEEIFKKDFPLEEKFIPLIEKWLIYKKEIGKEVKSEMSIKTQIKKLLDLSNHNFLMAEKIINQSIEHNWQGLFELKNKSSEPKKNSYVLKAGRIDICDII